MADRNHRAMKQLKEKYHSTFGKPHSTYCAPVKRDRVVPDAAKAVSEQLVAHK